MENTQGGDLSKVLKLKTKYFNENIVQERTEHLISHSKVLKLTPRKRSLMTTNGNKEKIRLLFNE